MDDLTDDDKAILAALLREVFSGHPFPRTNLRQLQEILAKLGPPEDDPLDEVQARR